MTTHYADVNGDGITIILTFAIIAFMFVGLFMEKMRNGELLDW